MKIRIKSIKITNFMGIKSFACEFTDETTISGDNGTGKSTIYDAFLWCLFGKNHRDNKDFYIKNTVDTSLNREDHCVEIALDVNREEVLLSKIYREKHEKIKGAEVSTFTGHETDYFYNLVPLKQKEYKEKIDGIVDEGLFKTITNVFYFNDLAPDQQRKLLIDIAETKTDEELAQKNPDFVKLISALTGKNMDEYKKQLAARNKLLKDELALLPTRISEASASKKQTDVFYDQIKLDSIKSEIKELQSKKDDISKLSNQEFEKIREKQQELSALKTKLSNLQQNRIGADSLNKLKAEGEIEETNQKITLLNNAINGYDNERTQYLSRITETESASTKLRAEYDELVKQVPPEINANDIKCPSCNRELDESILLNKKEELTNNWNKGLIQDKENINKRGQKNNEILADLKKSMVLTDEKISKARAEIENIKLALDAQTNKLESIASEKESIPTDEEIKIADQIEKFIIPESPKSDFGDLDDQIAKLNAENDKCISNITNIENNKTQDARIAELEQKEAAISKELASVEKTQFVIDEFVKLKMQEVEDSVNKMFKYATFKMFEDQINGGQKQTCVVMYGGVPYMGVNTAGRINIGLDIINTLTKHYGISAPVFIDNTESINKIIDTDLQIIKLQVSYEKQLTIKNN